MSQVSLFKIPAVWYEEIQMAQQSDVRFHRCKDVWHWSHFIHRLVHEQIYQL